MKIRYVTKGVVKATLLSLEEDLFYFDGEIPFVPPVGAVLCPLDDFVSMKVDGMYWDAQAPDAITVRVTLVDCLGFDRKGRLEAAGFQLLKDAPALTENRA